MGRAWMIEPINLRSTMGRSNLGGPFLFPSAHNSNANGNGDSKGGTASTRQTGPQSLLASFPVPTFSVAVLTLGGRAKVTQAPPPHQSAGFTRRASGCNPSALRVDSRRCGDGQGRTTKRKGATLRGRYALHNGRIAAMKKYHGFCGGIWSEPGRRASLALSCIAGVPFFLARGVVGYLSCRVGRFPVRQWHCTASCRKRTVALDSVAGAS